MARIAFIGAGSFGFTRSLVRDLLTFPLLEDSTIVLMDIDKDRLACIKEAVEGIIARKGTRARVEATLDRKAALKNADFVVCTVLAGGTEVWKHDILIPKKYNVDINVGDTRGVAGVFRALRTIPLMLDICRDMEKLCPKALLLNYTNPMAMLCRAMQKATPIQVTGLCHSVQGTAEMLAKWIGEKPDDIDYTCAGINHQAWYLRFEKNGKDLYPRIRKAVQTAKIYNEEIVRNEMYLHLGYYVTESSGHNSEYNAWFRKRPDLIEKYCTHGTGWNPGVYAFILDYYKDNDKTWQKKVRQWSKEDYSLERGHEYAAYIMNAWMGGQSFVFNGNVPNTGLITNLPQDVCVESPVYVDRAGLHPMHVGALPPQLAALNNISVAGEEMAVEAALTGNAEMVFHAIAYDPLTAAVLSLAEIRKMVKEMFEKNRPYLKRFKKINL